MRKVLVLLMILLMAEAAFAIDDAETKCPQAIIVDVRNDDSNETIEINLNDFGDEKLVALVFFDDETRVFHLEKNTNHLSFPGGAGDYVVQVYRHKSGQSYSLISENEIHLVKYEASFIEETSHIKWSGCESFMQMSNSIWEKSLLQEDKRRAYIEAAYRHISTNYSYDYEKAATIKPGYRPNSEKLLEEQKGICYDFATLFVTMMRYKGIPSKLVMGFQNESMTYHAWVECFVDGQWISIDPTIGIARYKNGLQEVIYENVDNYNTLKEY